MTAALPSNLLELPAPAGARAVALSLLDDAVAASRRLAGEDPEALHDFRVALRRLRSTLRAYREAGCKVPKREGRLLKDLAARTNAGRDAEVQLEWLRRQSPRLRPRERSGLRWLVARFEARLETEYADTVASVRGDFPRAERKVRRRLTRDRASATGAGAPPRFGTAARVALEAAAERLRTALGEVRGPGDEAEAHAARIAAKRLRYVLEPLAGRERDASDLVRRLKSLQDVLGELHDCHVLEAELAGAVGELGAERARRVHDAALASGTEAARRISRLGRDVGAGLTAVGRLVRARRDGLYKRLAQEWLRDGGSGFLARVEGAAAALEPPPAISPGPGRGPRRWRRGASAGPARRPGPGA